MDAELIQGSEQWRSARCGSLGASQVHEALARTKSGWGASRENVMAQLVAERLTGIPYESYINEAMQRGIDTEPEARAQYAFVADVDVVEVGLIRHPRIERSHCSPDGLVGEDGMLEIKSPNTSTHIATLLGAPIPQKYIYQMQWQLTCADRQWVDFVSFDNRMPDYARLFIQRVYRDDKMIADLEKAVEIFLSEVDEIGRASCRERV